MFRRIDLNLRILFSLKSLSYSLFNKEINIDYIFGEEVMFYLSYERVICGVVL